MNKGIKEKEQKFPEEGENSTSKNRRRRRSKHEAEGRNFICEQCGKAYLSQPALNNHKKMKHSEGQTLEKKPRGRPRKFPLNDNKQAEMENKFMNFLLEDRRKKIEGESISIHDLVKLVFDDIYVEFRDKCYIKPQNYNEHPLLEKLFNDEKPSEKPIEDKVCDDIFLEYLYDVMDKVNKNYLILLLKFTVLFREFMNIQRAKDCQGGDGPEDIAAKEDLDVAHHHEPLLEDQKPKKEYSTQGNADNAPDLCNDFVVDFLEGNNYFGIESEEDRNEIIELIQHFCHWIFKHKYTASRLTLLNE